MRTLSSIRTRLRLSSRFASLRNIQPTRRPSPHHPRRTPSPRYSFAEIPSTKASTDQLNHPPETDLVETSPDMNRHHRREVARERATERRRHRFWHHTPRRQVRHATIGDKISGAFMRLQGTITRRPGLKAAGTRRMNGTDGLGSKRSGWGGHRY